MSELRIRLLWWMATRREKIEMWVAWHLPRSIAMWCAVRVMVNATVGEHSHQVVPELLAMDALKRWEPRS